MRAGWSRRQALTFVAVFVGLFGGYFAWRTVYYGDLLPNTFYAKSAGTVALVERGWSQLTRFFHDCGGWAWIAAVGVLAKPRTRPAAWTLLGVVALRVAFHLWSGGPWMERHRFLIPALPFLQILTVAGLATFRSRSVRWGAVALASLVMLVPGWLGYPSQEAREIGYGQALRRAHGAFGQAVNSRTARDAVIAMDDAGLGPLVADRRTIDMLGLNDRHIAHLPGQFGKFDLEYLFHEQPDLIVLISLGPTPTRDADFRISHHAAIFRSPEFVDRYRFSRRFEFAPDYHLLVYRRTDSSAVPADF